ncbi:hypothetical protein DICPUDRAFT_148700 [Dictyostelium purpureum]|uniref:NADH dehydrogenase (Ubiquinone) complex I, assembly factor 6 n=1 Tax=Dictyostelium purpureum TaxID=5786 RepID=F0ZBS3_DICPU|nr:uncharacterized protein DICPUDRAFT_148700 [Dictyostelium purpureum]EGC38585.1 hypothetical protein DICPUDRAFT_148700 [Dictyostelium purpureum]|eukprot:XP_003284864.1 hypothetical protein DICPUDRAFT_148700 [Dictyostelium purpureum]
MIRNTLVFSNFGKRLVNNNYNNINKIKNAIYINSLNNNSKYFTTSNIKDSVDKKAEEITKKENVASPSSQSIEISDLAGNADYNFVFERAKKFDKENYLCSLLISDPVARRVAYALRTFNVETVANDFSPKSEKISKIRLQFWKDAINNIYNGKVYDQPLTRVLAQVIKEKKLSKTWFIRLLNRREKDVQSVQIKDMEDLEQYADDIHTSLLLLTLEGLGIKGNHDAEHCASHLGKAVGIMVLIRGTIFHLGNRKTYIPVSLTTKYGINTEALYRGDAQFDKMQNAIYEMASCAKLHLDKAKAFKNLPENAHQAFYSAAIVEDFLERLRKVDFNIFEFHNTNQHPFLLFKLYKNKLFKQF